jgi:hypothetical protein
MSNRTIFQWWQLHSMSSKITVQFSLKCYMSNELCIQHRLLRSSVVVTVTMRNMYKQRVLPILLQFVLAFDGILQLSCFVFDGYVLK